MWWHFLHIVGIIAAIVLLDALAVAFFAGMAALVRIANSLDVIVKLNQKEN